MLAGFDFDCYNTMMNTILCLGTSHTEGGWQGLRETKTPDQAWPGLLERHLGDQHRVINLGEASYSMEQYAFKLINALNTWPDITHVICELNTIGKLDVEITGDLHHQALTDLADYHPIHSRYTVATQAGRTWPTHSRPYRTSVSSQEAVDLYMAWHQLTEISPEVTVDSVTDMVQELRQGIISEQEKQWVNSKLSRITQHMPGTDRAMQILIDYLYFRAVYQDRSDHELIRHLSHMDHLSAVCDQHDIPIWFWQMHDAWWVDHCVYTHTFRDRLAHRWLWQDDQHAVKPWLMQRFSQAERQEFMGDSIHFLPVAWQTWVEERLAPWLIPNL